MMHRRSLLARTVRAGAAIAVAALVPLAAAPPARAQDTQADSFIRQFGDRLIAVVNGPGTYADKQRAVSPVIEGSVAVDEIARFCLGRYWSRATPQQQSEYTALFHHVLINSITGHLGEYRGVSYSMTETQDRAGDIYVGTTVRRPNAAPANVQWVVDMAGGTPKIVDVVAEGTSLRLTQRNDYGSYLASHGGSVAALISAMRANLARQG